MKEKIITQLRINKVLRTSISDITINLTVILGINMQKSSPLLRIGYYISATGSPTCFYGSDVGYLSAFDGNSCFRGIGASNNK